MIANRVRHFIAVAQARSFGQAATRIGIAQAPLSQSVQRLERDLGVVLFDRHPTGVTLTAAGRAYLPEAEVAVAASDRAAALARAEAAVVRPVRIGVITPALWGPLPRLLALAREMDVAVELVEGTTDELRDGLLDGRLDISFLAPPFAASARMTVMDFKTPPLVAAMAGSAAGEGHADVAELARALILFPRSYGPVLYDAVIDLFASRGCRPRIVFESPRMLTTLALVSAGLGSSVVSPSLAGALSVAGVVYRPFAPDLRAPSWPVSLAFLPLPERSPAARLLARWEEVATS